MRCYIAKPPNAISEVRVLDVEGFDAATEKDPRMLRELKKDLLDLLKPTTGKEGRNHFVKVKFPRLAYTISDVLVFIGEQHITTTHYHKEIFAFGFRSIQEIASCPKPAIILVQNKCGPDDEYDVNKATERFFSDHDPNRALLNLFDDLKVVRIPRWQQKNFFKQIHVLLKLVLWLGNKKRKQSKVKLSNRAWRELVTYVANNFDSPSLSIGKFLVDHLKERPSIRTATSFVKDALETVCEKSPEEKKATYLKACESAVAYIGIMDWIHNRHIRSNSTSSSPYLLSEFDASSLSPKQPHQYSLLLILSFLPPCFSLPLPTTLFADH